jgi:hypothetical protein
MHFARDEGHDLVAVCLFTGLVDHDQAVGVAVERNADIGAGAEHGSFQCAGCGRADARIDVHPVGFGADDGELRAEAAQGFRRGFETGAVGTVEHDFQLREILALANGLEAAADIAAARAGHVLGL